MRTGWIGVGALALASAVGAAAPASSGFASQTGRVTYQISSPLMKGRSVLTWSDSGRRFRQEITGTVGAAGKTRAISGWTLCDGKNLYTHDKSMGNQVVRQDPPKGNAAAGQQMPLIGMSRGVGTPIGKETLLGKPCEIREVGNARISVWQNLPLKMVSQGAPGQSFSMTAVRLEPGLKVAPGIFQLPKGLQVRVPRTRRLPNRPARR